MTKHWLSGVALLAALAFSGAASAQIKMGVAGPITGPNAAFGAQLVNGTQQAVDDINKAGGILGQQITLQQGDDVSDPKQGVSVANKFESALSRTTASRGDPSRDRHPHSAADTRPSNAGLP